MSIGGDDLNLGVQVSTLGKYWEQERECAAIGICTRHRAGGVKTLDLCGPLPTFLFVEPHEYNAYLEAHGSNTKIVKLPWDNKGLLWARQYQLEYVIENGVRWLFVLDDDYLALQARTQEFVNNQYWKLRRLGPCEHWIVYAGLIFFTLTFQAGRTGLSYQQANWRAKDPLLRISKANNWCVIDTSLFTKHGIQWDTRLNIFEDWDVSLALLKQRVPVNCWYGASFSGTKMASNRGGLQSLNLDRAQESKRDIELLRQKYGDIITARHSKAHNMYEPAVDWKKIRRALGVR